MKGWPMIKTRVAAAILVAFLLMALIASGCVATPTTAPAATVTPTPTPCAGGYTWAYGSVSPEFIDQVQEALVAAGLNGSVKASTFGENDGCGGYGAMEVDYEFTIQMKRLDVGSDLANTAASVLDIAKRFVDASPAPNLGNLSLVFQANDKRCTWVFRDGAWNGIDPHDPNEVACPVPTSDESQKLVDMLNVLSGDLACVISDVKANDLEAVLTCERPEGNNRYSVTVKLRLNGEGYNLTCFHGYPATETNVTGDAPMTVSENGNQYYERDRLFQWTAQGILYEITERVKGGLDVTLPPDAREKVFARALQAGLISGEGNICH
jgi:hypothetical protein